MTQKIVIHVDWGGYSLSSEIFERLKVLGHEELQGKEYDGFGYYDKIARNDPLLVRVIEEMADAKGQVGSLAIAEIPEGIVWVIEEYDGWEHVAEKHRKWGQYGEDDGD